MFSIDDNRLIIKGNFIKSTTVIVPELWVTDRKNNVQTQFCAGERVYIYAENRSKAFVQSARDSYCGWVKKKFLGDLPPAHYRTFFITPVLKEGNFKSPMINTLPPESFISVEMENEDYVKSYWGWIAKKHLEKPDTKRNIVKTAREQLGRSYVWGGRGIAGLDCSALTQFCFARAGIRIPRDSDLQKRYLMTQGVPVEIMKLQAADLVFMKGHVMVMSTPFSVVHANAFHMKVTEEPLLAVLMRAENKEICAYRWQTN